MSQSTADTINQAVLRMAKVFNDIGANKFLECLINKIDNDTAKTRNWWNHQDYNT